MNNYAKPVRYACYLLTTEAEFAILLAGLLAIVVLHRNFSPHTLAGVIMIEAFVWATVITSLRKWGVKRLKIVYRLEPPYGEIAGMSYVRRICRVIIAVEVFTAIAIT